MDQIAQKTVFMDVICIDEFWLLSPSCSKNRYRIALSLRIKVEFVGGH